MKNQYHAIQISDDLFREYKEAAEEKGMKASQLIRHTLKKEKSEPKNDTMIACKLTELTECLRSVRSEMSKEKYYECQDHIEDLIRLCK